MRSLVFLLVLIPIACGQTRSNPRQITDEEVMRVHKSALLIDTHNDIASEDAGVDRTGPLDFTRHRPKGHTDLERLRQGGVGAVFFAAWVSKSFVPKNQSAHQALVMIDTIRHDIIERYPNDFELALTADDIESAHKRGRIAALIGVEGGHAIEDSLSLLRSYYNLGVRYMTLTHSNHNNWADSSGTAGAPNNGLAPFGKQVVAEMNRLGMMVDISHVSDKTFWDVIEVSKAPPIASHSSCRAVTNIARNMTDDMIAALSKKGGVIQINIGCEFLSQASADASTWANPKLGDQIRAQVAREIKDPAQREKVTQQRLDAQDAREPRAKLADMVAHIDHAVKLAGIDSVGIGTDFDGVTCVPEGLDDVSKFPNLTRALLEHGYTPEQIRKIYGGNLLRVMRETERVARSLQAGK